MNEDIARAVDASVPDETSTLGLPHVISHSLNGTRQFYILI